MSGKGSKALRIEARREQNLGSPNVQRKRAWYARFKKLDPKQRREHRAEGQRQFGPKAAAS